MKISFVIPFHNENKNCLPMIERVVSYGKKEKLNFEVIPVDDRSTDGTGEILKKTVKKYKNVHPVYRKSDKVEKGNTMGKSLIAGTKAAKGEIIIWTMGDRSDDVETYGKMIKKIQKGYDIVFGSRYMPGGSRGNLDLLKAFLSSWGTRLAGLLFAVPVHDITNAFRAFKKEVFDVIGLESVGFSISPEFAIKAQLSGFRLGEVPTIYTNRVEGVSSFKIYKMTKSYLFLYMKLFYDFRLRPQFSRVSKGAGSKS
ncbi:glycosyltransferase [Patescibacteria group bacterium]|nr:glycosyltransferase [Patescibacteria group bacterium]MCL5797996.1 glycosyltransferase [Patescibacteria group bacterium]